MPMVMTTSSVDITPLLPLAIMLVMETNMTSDMDTRMDMERCWTKLLLGIPFTLGPTGLSLSSLPTKLRLQGKSR